MHYRNRLSLCMSQKVMGKAIALFIISLLFVGEYCLAQEKSKISAFQRRSSNDLDRSIQLIDKEPIKAIDLLSLYFKENLKHINKTEASEIYQLLGKAHYNLEQYDLALHNYFKAVNLLTARSSRLKTKVRLEVPVSIYYDFGEAYLAKNNWDSAVHYLDKFVNDYRENDNKRGEGLVALGEAHFGKQSLETAENYADEAINLSNEIDNEALKYRSSLLKGRILESTDNHDAALALYRRLLENAIDDDDLNMNKTVTDAISRVLEREGNFQSQLDFKKSALQNSIALQDSTWQNDLNLEIAELYLDNEQPGEAIPYLNSGLATSDQIGDLEQSLKASKSLSDVYAAQGDYSQALSNYEKYVDLVGQQYEQKQKEIELSKKVLESLYKNRETISLLEKDRELNASQIELLEKDRDQKNLLIYGLLTLIVIILTAGYLLYRSISQKRLANQLLTLKSLRSQMNPHFIFNALNSVNSFISKNDTRQANKYYRNFPDSCG